MDEEIKDPKKSFKVVDRRHWAEGEPTGAPDEEDSSESTPGKPQYVAELEQRLEEKEQLLRQYIAEHKASLSEFDKARARIGREVAKEAQRARREIIVEFLDVADNLDRAIEAAEAGQDPNAVVQGVAMVRDLVQGKLEGFGVYRMDAMGHSFDPAHHEALTVVPVDDPEQDGQIVGVIREGYQVDGDVLRPAAVAVARVPAK